MSLSSPLPLHKSLPCKRLFIIAYLVFFCWAPPSFLPLPTAEPKAFLPPLSLPALFDNELIALLFGKHVFLRSSELFRFNIIIVKLGEGREEFTERTERKRKGCGERGAESRLNCDTHQIMRGSGEGG